MIYDKDIREPLFLFLEEKMGKVRFLEEKRTGSAIADVVMILPGMICGIEIKSDADSYTRLAGQVKNYDKVYDRNYIVAGTKHAQHVREHVPEYWGVITVEKGEDGELDFYVLREPADNPSAQMREKIAFLWRPELAHIQELNLMPKYKEKSKLFVREKILEYVPHDILQKQICDELFERDYDLLIRKIDSFRAEQGRPKRRKTRKRKAVKHK
jgi:hypothetical protein